MKTNQTFKTWVEVSRSAIRQNIRTLRRALQPGVAAMAVVKSNAYGHGLVPVAQTADASGIEWFGVDNIDEAIELRKVGIKKPILILGWTPDARIQDCVDWDVSFVAYNMETARAIAKLKFADKKKTARIHLKIETGTSRQGVDGEDLRRLVRALKKIPGVVIEGVSTHFANIEDTKDHSFAERQLVRYEEALAFLKQEGIDSPWKHAACSAAALLFPETHFTLVRYGVSLYGLWSSQETRETARANGYLESSLKPAMTWKTRIAQIKDVYKGTPVSYGLTERVARDSKIAVIPVGYWDGYDRAGLSSVSEVLVKGVRCKVVGRICMNMCMIDVTDVPKAKVADEVILLGASGKDRITAEEVAAHCGTINYEIVTRVNPLLPRFLVQ